MSGKPPVPPSTTYTYSVYTPAPSEISVNRRWLNRIQEWTDDVPAGAEVASRAATPAPRPRRQLERHDSGRSLVSAVTTSSTVIPDDSISTRPTPRSKARQLPRDIATHAIPPQSQLHRSAPSKPADLPSVVDFSHARPSRPDSLAQSVGQFIRGSVVDPKELDRTSLNSPAAPIRSHSYQDARETTLDGAESHIGADIRYSGASTVTRPTLLSRGRSTPLAAEARPSEAELIRQEYRMSQSTQDEQVRPASAMPSNDPSRSDSTRVPSPASLADVSRSVAPPPLPPKQSRERRDWAATYTDRSSETARPGSNHRQSNRDSWESTSVIDHRAQKRVRLLHSTLPCCLELKSVPSFDRLSWTHLQIVLVRSRPKRVLESGTRTRLHRSHRQPSLRSSTKTLRNRKRRAASPPISCKGTPFMRRDLQTRSRPSTTRAVLTMIVSRQRRARRKPIRWQTM